jgi:hypothetical protein
MSVRQRGIVPRAASAVFSGFDRNQRAAVIEAQQNGHITVAALA